MREYEDLFEQVERMIHKYNQRENIRYKYGVEDLLTQTEIHLIAAIGAEPGIGVKKLAQKKGVTDGAVSQMIHKLVNKGLVAKRISSVSEAKIELTLTERGLICFTEHQKYHADKNIKWCNLFNRLDDKSYNEFIRLFQEIEKELDH